MHGPHARAAIALVLLLGLSFAFPARAQPCCGPITQDGQHLAALLDHSGVEILWLPHQHIDWLTGEPDPARPGWSPRATHCSAYAAAMAARMDVYLLRPPEHGQDLLANAQLHWLEGAGAGAGWKEVDAKTAQTLANQGFLAVAVFENPDPHDPGHIAVIRPSEKSLPALEAEGPEEAQAGSHNALSIPVAQGFAGHHGAWQPDGTGTIRFFAHAVDWANLSQ